MTAEEDFSYLENYLMKRSEWTEDSLYMVFQMLSSDELHIVSKEVMIEKYYHELYLKRPVLPDRH